MSFLQFDGEQEGSGWNSGALRQTLALVSHLILQLHTNIHGNELSLLAFSFLELPVVVAVATDNISVVVCCSSLDTLPQPNEEVNRAVSSLKCLILIEYFSLTMS